MATGGGGTPRWRRAPDDRRGAIIHAALAEFEANGLESARMDAIAHAAGLSKGSIYRYFPDKQGLFQTALTSAIAESLATYRLPGASDPELMVRRLWLLATGPRFAPAYRLSLTQGQGSDVETTINALIEQDLTQPLANYLRRSDRDPAPSSEDALTQARLVIATLLGASLVQAATPDSLTAPIAFLLRACGLDPQSPQADGF